MRRTGTYLGGSTIIYPGGWWPSPSDKRRKSKRRKANLRSATGARATFEPVHTKAARGDDRERAAGERAEAKAEVLMEAKKVQARQSEMIRAARKAERTKLAAGPISQGSGKLGTCPAKDVASMSSASSYLRSIQTNA